MHHDLGLSDAPLFGDVPIDLEKWADEDGRIDAQARWELVQDQADHWPDDERMIIFAKSSIVGGEFWK